MPTEEQLAWDARVRQTAFDWLNQMTGGQQTTITWQDILKFKEMNPWGVVLANRQRGIFKPKEMVGALSLKSSPPRNRNDRPFVYNDDYSEEGYLRYSEQASQDEDNANVRRAYEHRLPMVYLKGIAEGIYRATFPIYVIGYDSKQRQYLIDVSGANPDTGRVDFQFAAKSEVGKSYVSRTVEVREHQRDFRALVMTAYRTTCAVCALKHGELLDAAHVIGDREAGGIAAVKNGLALCKIHHSAFDSHVLGVDPDYTVHIREDILHEIDGPMLKYGLQSHHGQRLRVVPEKTPERPQRELLAHRFEQFKAAV
ncbi:HNH endonuclease signature motif containing protein [Nesterenkonia halobia]|uniref:HNH endonuclease n=1 Tax=Nesterenkonia halobia TaxID=37922 RepID=A0ABP6R6W1_9MICC